MLLLTGGPVTPLRILTAAALLPLVAGASALARENRQARAGAAPQVTKVCPLVTLAEVKKFAPWPAHMDQFAKAEEEPVGLSGSACQFPSVRVQVLTGSSLEAFRKAGANEPVAGVGDEAVLRDNRGRYAELAARVGKQTLTLQLSIGQGQTFDSAKPSLIGLAKIYVERLRGK
jgi:hypothetical protein